MAGSVILILFVLSAVTALILLVIGIFARNAPKSLYFTLMTLAIFIMNAGFIFEVTAQTFSTAFLATQAQYFGAPFISVFFLLFACEYSGVKLRLPHIIMLFAIPAAAWLLVLTWPINGLYYKSAVLVTDAVIPHLAVSGSVFYYVYIVYHLLATIAADIIFIYFYRKRDRVFKMQVRSFVLATALPVLGTIINNFGIIKFGFDPVPICLSLTCIILAYTFLKLGLNRVPPIAHGRILNTMSDGFIITDTYGKFIDANAVAKRILPRLATVSVGMALTEIEEIAWLGDRASMLDKEYNHKDQDGAEKRYRLTDTEVIYSDKVIGRCILLVEVTLEEALKDASAASRAKSDFLAKMSHEIRTPMNAVIGMAELALRENNPDVIKGHVFTIKQAGSNLLSIVNDILDFSKIESGKLEINPDYYLFSSLVSDVISIIRMRAVDSELCFVVNIDSNIPNELYGDEARIRQVLINILGNAVKYTEKGFVSFTVMGEHADEGSINLFIDVMDSGRGIKEEDIEKLFMDFTQVDVSKSKSVEGTGLGLAIAKNIIKEMGGEISVVSEYGKGSTFSVVMPQKFRSATRLAVVDKPEEKSVLVYERGDMQANSMVCTIDNLGVSCTLASDDAEFSEILATGRYPFIFISAEKFEQNRDAIEGFGRNSKVVLLAEFGDVVPNTGLSILSMPVQSISVANILNGESETFLYNEEAESYATFIAPEARVLVVDDIKTNLKVTEGLLLPYRVKVDVCNNGREAIRAVKTKRYDLVLMDHKMPEMDGVEATTRIRGLGISDPYFKNLPIIALTANAVSGVQEMFIANGFNGFLAKPSDNVRLNATLEKWLPKEKQKIAAAQSGAGEEKKIGDGPYSLEIDGVNLEKGVFHSGGSWKHYLETLAVFCDDANEKMEKLKVRPDQSMLSLYVTHAHALKGAAANIGAAELSNAAYELEQAGRRADLDYIEANTPVFLSNLESVTKRIRGALSSSGRTGGKKGAKKDNGELKKKLGELKNALESLDAGAMNSALNDLPGLAATDNERAIIKEISRSILLAEYDEAAALIDTLLQGGIE